MLKIKVVIFSQEQSKSWPYLTINQFGLKEKKHANS